MSNTVIYAEDIYDIPCEEKDGLLYPTFKSQGREELSIWARKALDLTAEMDRTALDLINMSGLYRTIWEEIAAASEEEYSSTVEIMKKKYPRTESWEQQAQQNEEIFSAARAARWDYLRAAVKWLIAACWEQEELSEIKKITLKSMTAA